VEHRQKGTMQCHHCGYTKRIPKECPSCHEKETLVSCGPGVERVYEEVIQAFPQTKAALITSETIGNPQEFKALSERILNGEVDILIGTQILAKGHNFPNLTLVGVIDADMGLAGGDLRAGERTFQLLHQVMGRAGRYQKKGQAVLQSYSPENLIIQALQKNDRSQFLTEEILSRQVLSMPPFGRLASFIISGKNQALTYQVAQNLVKTAPTQSDITVLGPVVAPLALLRGKYRFRILIKTPKDFKLQKMLSFWLKSQNIPSAVDVRLDIDPYSFF
jgi:primosomal protein N' (replication factor Y)